MQGTNGELSNTTRRYMVSMRDRYLSVALLFVVFLGSFAGVAQFLLNKAVDDINQNTNNRQQVQERLVTINGQLQDIQLNLQDYLIVPADAKYRRVNSVLVGITDSASSLAGINWIKQRSATKKETGELKKNLVSLTREVGLLMDTRGDRERLYPAGPLLAGTMEPNNQAFYDAASVAIAEAKEFADEKGQRKLRLLFSETRHYWTMMVSAWRAYIANRSGIFQKPEIGMRNQAINLSIYAEKLEHLMKQLAQYEKQDLLGFEQAESLKIMKDAKTKWHQAYLKSKKIYESSFWRADIPLIRNRVQPLFTNTRNNISKLEQSILQSAQSDEGKLTDTAGSLTGWIWFIAFAGALLSMGGFLLLEYTVRRPLRSMVNVFKAEALGPSDTPLPKSNLSETHDLVSAFHVMRNQVRSRQQRLETILDIAAEGILTFDESGIIESANTAAEELFGYTEEELIGNDLTLIMPPQGQDTRENYIDHFLRHEIQRCMGHEGEITGRHKNGIRIPISLKVSATMLDGELLYTAMVANISERKAMVEHLKQMAEKDGLTGLYNRSFFQEELDRISEQIRRNTNRQCALLYIDLDNFKYINDTMGHAAGDQLIVEVAELLNKRARKSDLLSRFGGDEFVVLLVDTDAKTATQVAESFRSRLANFQFNHEGEQVDIGCSIGVASMTNENYQPEDIMSQADLACHLAKRNGRNRVHLYDRENELDVTTMSLDMGWSRRIKTALEQDRFVLARQPVVRTQNRVTEGYEILLRLVDEQDSLVMPGGFLPSAERFGLAADIDRWVIAHAIEALAEQQAAESAIQYNINLSGMTLSDPGVCDLIKEQLDKTNINPSSITFEVTETVAIADMAAAEKVLSHIKSMGCKTALDDFGTGMSSFAYLKDLPVDIVKIDGRFVRNLSTSTVDQAMVRAMNDIAHALGKITVAEFVEDEDGFQLLKHFGVDYCQGYLLGKPVLMKSVEEVIGQQGQPAKVVKI